MDVITILIQMSIAVQIMISTETVFNVHLGWNSMEILALKSKDQDVFMVKSLIAKIVLMDSTTKMESVSEIFHTAKNTFLMVTVKYVKEDTKS